MMLMVMMMGIFNLLDMALFGRVSVLLLGMVGVCVCAHVSEGQR